MFGLCLWWTTIWEFPDFIELGFGDDRVFLEPWITSINSTWISSCCSQYLGKQSTVHRCAAVFVLSLCGFKGFGEGPGCAWGWPEEEEHWDLFVGVGGEYQREEDDGNQKSWWAGGVNLSSHCRRRGTEGPRGARAVSPTCSESVLAQVQEPAGFHQQFSALLLFFLPWKGSGNPKVEHPRMVRHGPWSFFL